MKKNPLALIIAGIVLILGIIILVVVKISEPKPNPNSNPSTKPEVVNPIEKKESYRYIVENLDTSFLDEDGTAISNLITSEIEYNNYLSNFNITNILSGEPATKDYEKYNYVIAILNVSECGEKIKYNKYNIYNKQLTILFDVKYTCGVCGPVFHIYEIPIPKDVTGIERVDYLYTVESRENCNSDVAYKPVLYLYPEKITNIKINFSQENNLTTTYPKFNNEWNITAYPNGNLYDKNNKYYYALYWEELQTTKVDFTSGFYVSKENAIPFLEEKLSILGLNNKEKNEFIMYWLPILEKNKHNLVYFELTEELQKANKIIIEPSPDTLIRIRMHVKKVSKETTITEQQLPKQERIGYTAVEWGGVIYNKK